MLRNALLLPEVGRVSCAAASHQHGFLPGVHVAVEVEGLTQWVRGALLFPSSLFGMPGQSILIGLTV